MVVKMAVLMVELMAEQMAGTTAVEMDESMVDMKAA